ncbi:hypothetical protein [Streptomyces cavernicola]|uniref:Transcriptional regulator n=1 Tax=Streptomyces cavernicola TaxID=3043613 RepID=A0ABT6S480_9ACTN|nr:hypothetical protein [Streptomyces sp. B-S-A6]MDI3402868.1 hypothetical protein [Streptomyces sp. B-S-A6]
MNQLDHCLNAADVANDLSGKARGALARGNKEGAVALVTVAHTYALMADADIPLPRDGGLELTPSVPRAPRPRRTTESTDTVEQQPTVPSGTQPPLTAPAEPAEPLDDEDEAVPAVLLRAYRTVAKAGGVMYGTDLADALGIRAQQIGKDLTRILRNVGLTRPNNGTVSPGPGQPYRNGYTAETLAAAVAAYRVRAELADAA